ncbi:MAG: peptide-methionine (S)-S-oxide reductase MsrA [Tepidiformaceae bacterium]
MPTDEMPSPILEIATLAGGCFWCLEAVYDELRGVEHVQSGYMGGHTASPTYEQVCGGRSGHAEVVQISFDPTQLSFAELLEVFFAIHDPTTLNRQGADVGTQYRSAIFTHSAEQHAVAGKFIADLGAKGEFPAPIVTEVVAAGPFFKAELYHDDYFLNNENQPYCQFVVAPKVAKFRKLFTESRKPEASDAASPSTLR